MTTNHTNYNQKQPEVSTFCNLTEQWKKGELEDGLYWVMLDVSGDGKIMQTTLSFSNGEPVGWRKKSIKEVLAPVPNYVEWKELSKQRNRLIRDINGLAYIQEENQQLKELLKECREWIEFLDVKMKSEKNPKNAMYFEVLLLKIDNAIGEK